jgi:acetolactate synthase-1/2/3 large subunit
MHEIEYDGPGKVKVDLPGYRPNIKGNARQIRLAAEAINKAKCPVIYAGGGVIIAGASELLLKLAETADAPVTTTLLGLGCFPETHRLALRMLGMHGTPWANHAVQNCDLLVAIGARFDDRVTGKVDTFAPKAEIIHIDIDPASISKSIRVEIPVVGDAKLILEDLLPHVKPAKHPEWLAQIDEWKTKHPMTYDRNCADGLVKPQYVVEQICEVTKGECIITTEVGQNQMWAAQWFRHTKPRHFISSGGLGTMGFGFPAAIGAQVGCPDAVVFDIAGDGSIQMNIQELATAVVNNIPVKIAVLNNGYLGMVRQWQELFYRHRYSGSTLSGNPDFVKVAEAYGAMGIRVSKTEDVAPAIERAIAHKGPVMLDFIVCPEENVFPMVPAGEAIDRMISGLA